MREYRGLRYHLKIFCMVKHGFNDKFDVLNYAGKDVVWAASKIFVACYPIGLFRTMS